MDFVLKYLIKVVATLRNPQYPLVRIPLRCIFLHPFFFTPLTLIVQSIFVKKILKIDCNDTVVSQFKNKIIEYNLSVLKDKIIITSRRSDVIYDIARVLCRNASNRDLLILGPMTIHELLIAWLYGFSWNRINAVDFISLLKKVKQVDIENMTFQNKFDVICASAVFSCSEDINSVFSRVANALRVGGLFVFQATYSPDEREFPAEQITRREYEYLIKNNGLELIMCDWDRVRDRKNIMYFCAVKDKDDA